jgi:hypothetical protein
MAAEAARTKGNHKVEAQAPPATDPDVPRVLIVDDPQRPPLAPEPALNQNDAQSDNRARPSARRRPRTGRLVARVLLAPLYIVIAAGSALILVLAAKNFLGL